ncbi:MAG: hypothetical protein MJD61_00245 [Proteobacteria bacterium]|nr:hypothetical protein [Pseudomonadota bacterium]
MWVVVLASLTTLFWTSPTLAQRLKTTGTLGVGSGLSWGNADGNATVTKRTPLFLEMGVRLVNDEKPKLVWSGALRAEIAGRTSVAVVPRVELMRPAGSLVLHASAGTPVFLAPFTLVGAETALAGSMDFGGASVYATLMLDAFVFGTDLPHNSSLIMLNLMLGAFVDL